MNTYRERILEKAKELTNEQIEKIMHSYYEEKATMKQLQEAFDLKGIALSELHYIFPPNKTDKECKYCGEVLVQNRPKRDRSRFDVEENAYCPSCGHEDSSNCRCAKCVAEQRRLEKEEVERKIAFLRRKIDIEKYVPVDINSLTIKQKVYLGTFLRAGINKQFDRISPLGGYAGKLFPTDDYLHIAFRELFYNDIIKIHPNSLVGEFTPKYEEDSYTFNWKNVGLYPNIYSDEVEYDNIISELLNPKPWNDIYTDDALSLWKEIIYWECVDLLMFRMEAYEFDYTVGKETKAFFEDVVNNFPISQIYSIIWNGAKNAAAYYLESKVPKQQAANSVLSRMRNAADRIISGQWNRYDYSRPKDCPQSLISEYFFNSVIKICDQGWNRVPCIIQKPEDPKII